MELRNAQPCHVSRVRFQGRDATKKTMGCPCPSDLLCPSGGGHHATTRASRGPHHAGLTNDDTRIKQPCLLTRRPTSWRHRFRAHSSNGRNPWPWLRCQRRERGGGENGRSFHPLLPNNPDDPILITKGNPRGHAPKHKRTARRTATRLASSLNLN